MTLNDKDTLDYIAGKIACMLVSVSVLKFTTLNQTWEGVIGPEGVGKCNSDGLLLIRKCAEHVLLIINTVFRLPNRNKTPWTHPRLKHWHLIDYVIVRRTDRQYVRVTKTMCGADCWTDHRLVVSKLNLRIQPTRRPQGKTSPKRLDVSKLNKDSTRQAFFTDICNQLDAINLSSENPKETRQFSVKQFILQLLLL